MMKIVTLSVNSAHVDHVIPLHRDQSFSYLKKSIFCSYHINKNITFSLGFYLS